MADYLSGYADRRMPRIFLLGMISGFPHALIGGSGLSLWLRDSGLSLSAIGFAGLIMTVYAVNFLWAPLIDRLPVPFLSQHFGRRKGWILACQGVIILALLAWGVLDPMANLALVVAVGIIIATASATQDITIDALRIEQIGQDENKTMAAGAAVVVMGWWTGFKIGGFILLILADWFQAVGLENYWPYAFAVMIAVVLVLMLGVAMVPESPPPPPDTKDTKHAQKQTLGLWLKETVIAPLTSFFRHNGVRLALMLLGFIFLFKIGEAFLGRLAVVFYSDIGFSKSDIAIFSKGLGWITTITFAFIGGIFAMRAGTVKILFIAGIAMASTNFLFSLLAWSDKSFVLFGLAVVLDEFTAAFATVAFVAFISLLVDRRYTATQYALLASIGTAARTVFASSAGVLVDGLGGDWGVFFIITALMVLPSLILLWRIGKGLKPSNASDG